jgi:hypothetical protein
MRLLGVLCVLMCLTRARAQCGEARYNVLVPVENAERKCGVNADSICSTYSSGGSYGYCPHWKWNLPASACPVIGGQYIGNNYFTTRGSTESTFWAVDFGLEISITKVEIDVQTRDGNIFRVTIGNVNAIGSNAICADKTQNGYFDNYIMNCALKGRYLHVFLVGPQEFHARDTLDLANLKVSATLSSCITCPTGSTNSFSASTKTISDCKCNMGYTGTDGSACNACAIGKNKNSIGSVSCTNCPAGSYSSTAGASACVTCGAGNFSTTVGATSASTCVPCPADTYSNLTHGSGGRCAACPTKYSSLPGGTNISACGCSPGRTIRTENTCAEATWGLERSCGGACVASQKYTSVINGVPQDAAFAVDGSTDGALPNHARSGWMNPTNDQWWRLDLTRPIMAFEIRVWTRELMPSNAYVQVYVGNQETHNLNSNCGSLKPSSTLSIQCWGRVGRYVHIVASGNWYGDFVLVEVQIQGCDMCTECFGGTYKSEIGTNACTSCPVGTAGLRILGANSSSHCTNCVAGKYNDRVAMDHIDNCLVCPAGQTSLAGASVCRTACVAGKYVVGAGCTDCEAGKYSVNLDSPSCAGCLPGTYSTTVRATSASVCLMCPSNTFSSGNASACAACQANALSVAGSAGQEYCYCKPGYAHAAGSYTCRICDQGTWNSQLGRSACSNCSVGLYSLNYGATGNETCLPCVLGQWSPEGSANCNLCPVNSRAPVSSGLLSSCVCDAGYTGANGATCTACPAGQYKTVTGSSACIVCAVGKASSTVGASAESVCIDCAAGTYASAAGASACVPCPAGAFSDATGANSSNTCVPCPAGAFSGVAGASSTSACVLCPVGSYTLPGASACVLCPEGTHSNRTGASACTACEVGKTTLPGAKSAMQCFELDCPGHSTTSTFRRNARRIPLDL